MDEPAGCRRSTGVPGGRSRRSLPRALGALAAIAGGGMLVAQLPQLFVALGSITTPAPILLPLGLLLVSVGALARAVQTRSASRMCGVESWWRRDLELSATAYATNRVVKSGGLAGLVHHLADADRHGRSRRAVTLAYAVSKVADMVAFALTTTVVVAAGAVTGVLSGATLVAATITLGYALAQVAVLGLVVRHPRHLRRLLDRARATCARLRRRPKTEAGSEVLDDLTTVVTVLRTDPRAAVPILASACVGKLVGLATLLLVLAGLGLTVDPVSIAVIFVLGLAAAMLGPLPGGVGTTEASLAALLGMVGVAAGAAAGAVMAFRLFDFWLPTILGFAVGACTSSRRARASRAGALRDADVNLLEASIA